MPEQQYTDSAHTDMLTEYILENCKIPKYNEKLHIILQTPQHLAMLNQLKLRFWDYFKRAVKNAISKFYGKIFAQYRVPTDIEKLDQMRSNVVNSESMDYDQLRKMLLKQEQVKILVNEDRKNRWHNWLESMFTSLDLEFSVSEELIPLIPLSEISARHQEKPIHFDGTVIGVDVKQLITVEVLTENGGWMRPHVYDKNEHGRILNRKNEDVQNLLVEEMPDTSARDRILRKVAVRTYERFTGRYEHGDKIRILGYYQYIEDDEEKLLKRVFINCINIEKLDEDEDIILAEHDIHTIQEQIQKNADDYITDLTKSFAPHIIGNKIQKLAMLLVGVRGKIYGDNRSNIHVIFIDNPGSAKSELLKWASNVFQHSAYVDTPNASAQGLLYGQEEFDKRKILHAGVMIRYNLILLDELDKIETKERRKINTAIEQQLATYNKVPFKEKRLLDVSIIAAANPQGERWIEDRSIMDNLKSLEPSLISRCIVLRTEKNDNIDALVDVITNGPKAVNNTQVKFTQKQITGIVNYCKDITPEFTDDSRKLLKEFLNSFKTLQKSKHADLPIDTRKEIDLMRISSAIAKLLFKNYVDEQSVQMAVWFYKSCLNSIGMETDTPTTAMKSFDTSREELFWLIFNALAENNKEGVVKESDLKDEMEKSGKWTTVEKINYFVTNMHKMGRVYEPHAGVLKKA